MCHIYPKPQPETQAVSCSVPDSESYCTSRFLHIHVRLSSRSFSSASPACLPDIPLLALVTHTPSSFDRMIRRHQRDLPAETMKGCCWKVDRTNPSSPNKPIILPRRWLSEVLPSTTNPEAHHAMHLSTLSSPSNPLLFFVLLFLIYNVSSLNGDQPQAQALRGETDLPPLPDLC